MDTETQIACVLGVHRRERPGPAPSRLDPLWAWDALGFPGVYSVRFYPTQAGQARWRSRRTVRFPSICCACGAPAADTVDFVPHVRFGPIRFRRVTPFARAIPHCPIHLRRDPHAFVTGHDLDQPWAQILVFAMHRPFLDAVLNLHADDGDILPPWVTFPGSLPFIHWNQGINEDWMGVAWRPFWRRLDALQRDEYLKRWHAPEPWAEHLSTDARASPYRGDGDGA